MAPATGRPRVVHFSSARHPCAAPLLTPAPFYLARLHSKAPSRPTPAQPKLVRAEMTWTFVDTLLLRRLPTFWYQPQLRPHSEYHSTLQSPQQTPTTAECSPTPAWCSFPAATLLRDCPSVRA